MLATRTLLWTCSASLNQQVIVEAADNLRQGRLIIIPTDTVYGIAALFTDPAAVASLQKIKNRPQDKLIPILASDISQVETLQAHFGKCGRQLARRYWPGPLTLVLAVGNNWEGFRIPDHPAALAIIKAAGGLLRVTSANISGQPPALTVNDALKDLPEGIGLVVDAGPAAGGIASTVVKIIDEEIIILREGAISREEILSVRYAS
jgi:L-threonylcarbamoyladenylate synthase